MNIDFYFDPTCPFCWITSRWLEIVSENREININWKPFSLAIKNNTLDPTRKSDNSHASDHRASHRILRIIEASAELGVQKDKLYSDFGKIKHLEGYDYDDLAIKLVLSLNKLPESLLEDADSTKYDDTIEQSMKEALSLAGEETGVPIVAFTLEDGSKIGYFGPVLQSLPSKNSCLTLWDNISKIATLSEFYELKRARPSGMPNTNSTANQPSNIC